MGDVEDPAVAEHVRVDGALDANVPALLRPPADAHDDRERRHEEREHERPADAAEPPARPRRGHRASGYRRPARSPSRATPVKPSESSDTSWSTTACRGTSG